jgi:hypothetical protein
LDILLGCKDDVEQDPRVVWKWLALRLRLCASNEEKSNCLEDAVGAVERFDLTHAIVFIQAVLIVWADGAGEQSEALRRFVQALERVGAWEKEVCARIAEATKGSVDVIEAFRAIHDIR